MPKAAPPNPAPQPAPRQSLPRALSTLNDDGSRRWLNPRLSPGRFLSARRGVAWLLLAIYTLVPFLKIDGKPVLLLDLAARRFTILGHTFLPTDTLVLALFMVGLFLTIFLLTALSGRVWCGWACPQTVYMEFVFRPIERLFEGAPGRAKRALRGTGVARAAKYLVYLLVCGHLANTFLAYFVSAETVYQWTLHPPTQHPAGFALVAAVTALMMFDFCFFREQTCLVACPYGRFQSVMLDRNSLIISYDPARGEPRGRRGTLTKAESLALPVLGDCVDCKMCVTTCPTGIDIRDGLQMECVNCAQCIDACDSVMTRLNKPRGLIRYTSQAALAGAKTRILRARTAIYATLLTVIIAAGATLLLTAQTADVRVLRSRGAPFALLPDGLISNSVTIKLANRDDAPVAFTIAIDSPDGVSIRCERDHDALAPTETAAFPAIITAPPSLFSAGSLNVSIRVTGSNGFSTTLRHRLLGPLTPPATTPTTPKEGAP